MVRGRGIEIGQIKNEDFPNKVIDLGFFREPGPFDHAPLHLVDVADGD